MTLHSLVFWRSWPVRRILNKGAQIALGEILCDLDMHNLKVEITGDVAICDLEHFDDKALGLLGTIQGSHSLAYGVMAATA